MQSNLWKTQVQYDLASEINCTFAWFKECNECNDGGGQMDLMEHQDLKELNVLALPRHGGSAES